MQNILVLCIGNICRSPIAEALLRQQFPDKTISSAGLGALVGYPADPLSIEVSAEQGVDLSALQSPQAQALMLLLAKYPDMLTAAAVDFAPHDVTFYLRELAASYHSYYDAERILVDDERVKTARLALVAATAQVLHNGLAVLGVSAPRRM